MFSVDELTGDITLRQGDDGVYTLVDIETDYTFTPYLAVTDEDYKPIGEQITGTVEYIDEKKNVSFKFEPEFTDLLVVKKGQETATYIFGVKLSNSVEKIEDTLIIGNKDAYGVNTITVLPKIVEG